MKTIVSLITGIFLVGLLYVALFQYTSVPILAYSQCANPTEYKIGSIDSRFGLTPTQALDDIKQASALWNEAYGKEVFSDSPKADLTINFVYDERQALNSKINQLNNDADEKEKTLSQQIQQHKADVAAFEARLNEFTKTVDRYNKEGGAPEETYEELIKQQEQLKADSDALNSRARELNLSTQNYNSDISVLNKDVNQFNETLKQKPEEGIYDGNTNTISIYFADKKDELVHTLAHELGHSIGMDHVRNEVAIMYPNTTETLALTSDDLAQLKYACRAQSKLIHQVYSLNELIYDLTKSFAKPQSN